MTERSEKGKKNKIIGTFASLLRKTDLSRKEYKTIKTSFKVDEFTDTPTERLTERLTEWFNKCLKSIENEDANEDINVNKDESENEKVVFPFDSKDFFKFWQQWKDYKKDEYNFKYKSPASEQAALMKLSKLSNTNEKTATNIIMQSIENGWKGFFELKDKNNAKGLTEERAKSILKDWDD